MAEFWQRAFNGRPATDSVATGHVFVACEPNGNAGSVPTLTDGSDRGSFARAVNEIRSEPGQVAFYRDREWTADGNGGWTCPLLGEHVESFNAQTCPGGAFITVLGSGERLPGG